MEFSKYQHLEKFGTTEVRNIEIGTCHIFPKIDGTNAQLWVNSNKLCAGSRNRQLSLDKDNAGFMKWAVKQNNIKDFFSAHPNLKLYGEWLIPHTLRTYVDSAWNDFYVFDVTDSKKYLSYEEYSILLNKYKINYITPICIIKNPTAETIYKCLDKNDFLIKDNEGVGEGIVIKNYNFVNKYNNVKWAKIVKTEFKVKNQKVFGPREVKEKNTVEEQIVTEFINSALVEKEYAKIEVSDGWNSKMIPRLLNTVFYCLIKENSWEFVKRHKNPTINFKRLMSLTFAKVKELKSELF